MIKKNYRIILLNDKTQFNKSFSFTKTGLIFNCLLLAIFFFAASFGIFRFIKPHVAQQDYINLKNNQNNLITYINNIQNISANDSTVLLNSDKISDIFSYNKQLIPNNAPVDGIVTRSLIGEAAHAHNGLDIAAKLNSPIYAAQEGLVVFADSLIDLGNTIIIAHPNNFITLYSHLNKIKVHMRDYVKSKQVIGTIGESGNSNGPHLHFEIWQNSNIIDPRELIKEYQLKDVSVK